MDICVLGINHKTAPLELREKLSIPFHETGSWLKKLEERRIFDERVLISTCNRTEIYGVDGRGNGSVRRAKEFLSEYAGTELSLFEDKLYVLRQPDSVEHLFSVASGLDSMVLGETEILGQVKEAYLAAHENRQTGKILNNLFQRSLRVAKHVRTRTEIGQGRVSVASVAVDLAEKIFDSLRNIRVMVVGTGEMALQVTKTLVGKGARSMIISSRHFDRAKDIASAMGGEAVHYEDFENRIEEADILIASTLAPKVLIRAEQVRGWMRRRHERPLFMIDIAVPRNIDASAEKLDNVYLYNIDDLQSIAEHNLASRRSQLDRCMDLVRHQKQHFMDWLGREFGPR